MTFTIEASQLLAQVDVPDSDSEVDLETLRNLVHTAVRPMLDAVGFNQGAAYDLDVTSAVLPSGEHVGFQARIETLGTPSRNHLLPVQEMLTLAGEDTCLTQALADLREAIKQPTDTGFFCLRAVEALSHHWNVAKNRKRHELEKCLRIDPQVWEFLKKLADKRRHGNVSTGISAADRFTALRVAWLVVERFALMKANPDGSGIPTSRVDLSSYHD